MNVTLLIRMGMVTAMVGDPTPDRSLERHRSRRAEETCNRTPGLEGRVAEQPMQPQRHAKANEKKEQKKRCCVDGRYAVREGVMQGKATADQGNAYQKRVLNAFPQDMRAADVNAWDC
jgi:hypothetical protein